MTLLTIILLAIITFTSRYLFIHPKMPIKIGDKMSHFLSFSAPAVLTAIWVPIIFIKDHELNLSHTNPYLLSATVAVLISAKTKNIYLTLFVSLSLFIALKILI